MATVTSSKRQQTHTSSTYESNGDVTIGGNLNINGTTTTIDTANLLVEDKNIIIGDVTTPSDTTADGGGITLKGATDKTLNWVNSTDAWTSNQSFSTPNLLLTSLPSYGSEATALVLDASTNNVGKRELGSNAFNSTTIPSGNQIIDWTQDMGATNVHANNYSNTWRSIDDTPVNGVTDQSISSNWAFDHTASSTAHPRDTRSQIAGTYNNYSLPSSVVHDTEGGALHATNALSISGHTITLKRGNNSTETVVVPDNNTVYTHPTSAGNKHVPTGGGAGQFLKYSSSGTATWATPSYIANTWRSISNDTNSTSTTVSASSAAVKAAYDRSWPDTNTTYNIGDGGLTQKNFTTVLKDKLDLIAASANNYSFPYTISQSAGNETVVRRSNSGYIYANYFNGTGTFSTNGISSGMGLFTGTNGTDTFGRSYTAAAARTLLNVENGATADQTAAQILTAIKTVDVNGTSGINAGTFDGQQGSYYWSQASNGLAGANRISSTNNFNNTLPSGFYQSSTASNRPASSWHNMINVRHNNTSNDHGFQLSMGYYSNHLYSRSYQGGTGSNNGTYQTWAKQWSDQNDGSGSGLDADKLDGQHGSYYGTASAVAANTAKISYTAASAVAANTAKISYTAASAVAANTAKTGITSGQASAIVANTAKTGITSGQASAIAANTGKISYNSTASNKLATIATSANNYSHPTGAGNGHIPSGGGAGKFLKYYSSGVAIWETPSYIANTDTNTWRSISNATNSTSTTVSASSAAVKAAYDRSWPDTNTTYSVGDGGLTQKNFTSTLKTKLDGVATSANNYSHPTSAGNKHVPTGGAAGQFLKYSSSGVATWATPSYTTNTDTNTWRSISNATNSTNSSVSASSAAVKAAYDRSWPDTNTTYSVGDGGLTQKNFTTTLKSKLDGVATSANNYSLPAGSSSTRGGFKTGFTESGKNYPIELSYEKMYVNVPWTDTNTTYSVGDGGLTQKNFTTTLKSKLDGVAASANNYIRPSTQPTFIATSGNNNGFGFWGVPNSYSIMMGSNQANHGTVTDYSMHHNMGPSSGRGFTFGSSRTAVSASINALTGAIQTNGTVVWSGGGSANANTAYTHSQAAHAPSNANNYSHPTGAGNSHIPSGGGAGKFLKYYSSGVAVWETPSYTTNTDTDTWRSISSSVSSTNSSVSASSAAVKTAYDKANAALPKSGGTMTGYLTMSQDHHINRPFTLIDNSSIAYVLLCANAGNNNVNGRLTMARTSGLRHACQVDILVSAGSSYAPVGTVSSRGTAGNGTPSYRLVTCTYNSVSHVALEITNPDNYYDSSTARFTGRIKSTGSTLICKTPANVSSVALFGANSSHQIDGNTVWHAGNLSMGSRNVTRVTSTYSITSSDEVVFCNTDAGGYTATLPVGVTGQTRRIVNTGSNTLTIAPNGGEHLLGASGNYSGSSQSLSAGQSLELSYHTSDGWY